MPRRLDPPGTRSRTMGQENGKKVDKSQESWATPASGRHFPSVRAGKTGYFLISMTWRQVAKNMVDRWKICLSRQLLRFPHVHRDSSAFSPPN